MAAAPGNPSCAAATVRSVWRFAHTRTYSDLPGWDGVTHVITIKRDLETRKVRVWVTGSACTSDPRTLPLDVAEALRTSGRSAVRRELDNPDPAEHVIVTATGIDHRRPVAA
jgi:hypothetical protein